MVCAQRELREETGFSAENFIHLGQFWPGRISEDFTPAVDRGIRRGRIRAAPTDAPVMQGRISIDQAVRVLEGRELIKHAGPQILMIDQDNWKTFEISESLAPPSFLPTFVWP